MGFIRVRGIEAAVGRLNSISSQWPSLVDAAGRGAILALAEQWSRSSDPNGTQWAPKKRPNGQPTLVETGKLKRGFTFRAVNRNRVRIRNPIFAAYGHYHQSGTSRMPRRAIYPSGSSTVWTNHILKTVGKQLRLILK